MKLIDEVISDPSRFGPADLSAGRRLVKELAGPPADEELTNLTGSRLEFRGILSKPATPRRFEAPEGNSGRVLPYTAELQQTEPAVRPVVVWVPEIPQTREGFDVLQKFEGTVQAVQGDSFTGRLVDKTHFGPEEEAEIPLAEIMPGDRELVQPGAVFYWVIGYRREEHGQLSRSSMIRFQRLPAWSPADVVRAKAAAETFLSFLDLERANKPAGA
jgi:hypothetical protein